MPDRHPDRHDPNAATPLPALTLDTGAMPPADRLQAWRSAIPQDEAEPAAESGGAFEVVARAWFLGDVVVTHTVVSAVRLHRTVERIRADGADTCNLHVLLRGSWTGDIDGREMTVGPGQLVGLDLSRPFVVNSAPSESVSIVIGRNALADAVRGEPALHGRVFEGAAGLLLSDHCLALARHLPHATTADAAPIVQATLTLLAAALPAASSTASSTAPRAASSTTPAGGAVRNGVRRDVRRDVRRYVDRHIGAADLGPEGICRALGLSRSALYRSFRSAGGVAAYIQRRRLQAVRALLLNPNETRTIADVADSLGFSGGSHFAAAFRREFGCSPSDVRRNQRVPLDPHAATGEVGSRFRAWLAGLDAR